MRKIPPTTAARVDDRGGRGAGGGDEMNCVLCDHTQPGAKTVDGALLCRTPLGGKKLAELRSCCFVLSMSALVDRCQHTFAPPRGRGSTTNVKSSSPEYRLAVSKPVDRHSWLGQTA
jgi:hypothetical protein